ncbi:MAG: type IV secretory system conjugative DNA transfer family protein [Ruminococcus sp.]|nr:type IV secretory system conjugative DNA transfer family protein [Ruminococcus sp.]
MGEPPKKTDTLLYFIIAACVIAFPVIVLLGYTFEMTADEQGNIQIFEAVNHLAEYMTPLNFGRAFGQIITGSGMTRKAAVVGFFGSLIAVMYRVMGNGKRYHRKGEEHGSARWGNKQEKEIIADTTKKGFYNNVICASDIFLVLDRKVREQNEAAEESEKSKKKKGRKKSDRKKPDKDLSGTEFSIKDVTCRSGASEKIKPMLNLNMLISGGSGTGKSRFYVKPNLLQCNTSFVVTDPSGELVESCGKMLMSHGYEIKVFNLNDMKHSSNYNPFHYLRDSTGEINSNNVIKMINVFMTNTKGEGSSGDPFWDDAARLLLSAVSFLVIETGTKEEQNFAGVLDLIHKAKVVEAKPGKPEEKSELDHIFEKRKEKAPKALSVQYYTEFKQAAGKTMQSILISTTTKLQYFKLESVRDLTHTDNIHLEEIGDRKTALFIVIPSTDTTYNFLAAMMYTQLFDTLYDRAINLYHGRLPEHVRFVLDEFPNTGKIPEFEKILATCRKFEISAQVIVQNLSQLKRLYEKSWEELPGNCDTLIYLGGKDQFTNEYLSKELGKETIDQLSINQTKGKQGSSSYNNAILGRELATIDELSTMDNNDCIVMIRGLRPFMSHKFNLSEHPRYPELGEDWKPDKDSGETNLDNPYIYCLDKNVSTDLETEYVDFREFVSGSEAKGEVLKLRFVTSEEDTEPERCADIMSDIPEHIRKKFECCKEIYSV